MKTFEFFFFFVLISRCITQRTKGNSKLQALLLSGICTLEKFVLRQYEWTNGKTYFQIEFVALTYLTSLILNQKRTKIVFRWACSETVSLWLIHPNTLYMSVCHCTILCSDSGSPCVVLTTAAGNIALWAKKTFFSKRF